MLGGSQAGSENMKICGVKMSEVSRGSLAVVPAVRFFSGEAIGVLGGAGNWEPQSLPLCSWYASQFYWSLGG